MFVIVWRFEVKPGCEQEFERAYGSNGVWAEFFATDPGFINVELLRDAGNPRVFLTIDRWKAEKNYDEFSRQNASRYREIDKQCERLTLQETLIGKFGSHDPKG